MSGFPIDQDKIRIDQKSFPLRIGDAGRAIFFQFICFTKKTGKYFCHKNISILCKIGQGIQMLAQNFHITCGS